MADKNCSICGGKGYYCEFSTVETCWCVEPTPVAYEISDLKAEVAKLKRLIAERWKPEVERLRSAIQAVHAEIDGNIRPLTRDLVNMVSGLKNGSHPNDIYDHCDEIDRIIDAALEGGGNG